nr:DUF748 domain-containing protein [uncultured Desulfuromonas sp.]
MSRWMKRSLITVGVIVGLLLLSMLIVPWQVKKQGTAWIAENTERTLTIEKAYFNPFTLKLQLSGVTLTEQASDQPFVSWDRLMVAVSLRSIIDQALILRRIEVDHPYVKIDMLGAQEFNFSDFMHLSDDAPPVEPAPEEESGPFLFSFNNIVISDGEIDFNDQASPQSSHHEIRQLTLSVPVIGNVDYLADEYVTPELSMLLNGSDIHAEGQSKPFDNSLETNLSLAFFNTDLAFYAQNAPVALPVDVQSGILDCEINLTYLVTQDELPKLLVNGDFALSDLVVNEPDGKPLFAMPTLLLDVEQADVFQQDVTLSQIALFEPHLWLSRDEQAQLNLTRLFSSSEPQSQEPPAVEDGDEGEGSIPLVLIRSLALHNGQLSFDDQSLKTPVAERIHDLNLTVDNFSTHPDQQATLDLHLQTDHQLDVAINGQLGAVPAQADLALSANGLQLEPYYPYLEQLLTSPLSGQVDAAAQLVYADGNTLVHDGAVTLSDLVVPFSGEDRFTLKQLQLSGTAVDVNAQKVQLGQLSLTDGDIKATRLADGSLSPEKLLRPTQQQTSQTTTTQQDSKPWNINLASFDLGPFKLQFRDETSEKKPVLIVKQVGVHAENLSYPKATKSPFKVSANIGKKGEVRVDGSVVHTPLNVVATSRIKAFPLDDFNDFIPDDLKLKVKDGQLFSTMNVRLNQQRDGVKGTFSGDVAVHRFNLLDSFGGEMVRWDGLNLSGIQGDVAPFALHIKEVALNDYQANIEVAADGQVNLTSVQASEAVTAEGEEAVDPEPEEVVVSEATAPESTEPPADIRIDAVTLQGGTVSFTDRHLPSTFATTMYDLGGRISGLASDEEMQADVDLRGQLENNSPLTITGKLNPLSQDLFADLTISFKDIDLSPMTPYSGTYLGYAIDKGKLYLDLNYNIEHQQIEADNKVMIDQFTFGDTIDSEQATSLPVAFAISLLKDRNDEIHLDIPISGNLNDPDFSLASTIFTVLRNLLVKAATSPFALLSSLIPEGEDVSSISFTLGCSNISADQTHVLDSLAEVLTKRPSLILEISPYADQNNDPEAYRRQQLTEMLQAVKWDDMNDKQRQDMTVGEVQITDEEYPDVLKQVYKDAEFPRPRNVLGFLKSLPPEEMEKLLLANIRAGDEEMAALAKARAMAVRDGILAINPELKPRLFLMTTEIYAEPETGPASRVEFGINAK